MQFHLQICDTPLRFCVSVILHFVTAVTGNLQQNRNEIQLSNFYVVSKLLSLQKLDQVLSLSQ